MQNSPIHPIVASVPRLALRPPEMAEALGISEGTLAKWTDFPRIKINGTVIHPVESSCEWLVERARSQSREVLGGEESAEG